MQIYTKYLILDESSCIETLYGNTRAGEIHQSIIRGSSVIICGYSSQMILYDNIITVILESAGTLLSTLIHMTEAINFTTTTVQFSSFNIWHLLNIVQQYFHGSRNTDV